jgi:5-methylcytosine-specific restriction endonuclease McrA
MPFPEAVKDAAFARCKGQCECKRTPHRHARGRCTTALTRTNAQYHPVIAVGAGGSDTLTNCEVLCVPCNRATGSYGSI